MTHAAPDRLAVDPTAPGQRPLRPARVPPEPRSPSVKAPAAYDSASFAAGQDCGTRVAACIARLSALELTGGSRWWNRREHQLMADALLALAEELESGADAEGRDASSGPGSTGPGETRAAPGPARR